MSTLNSNIIIELHLEHFVYYIHHLFLFQFPKPQGMSLHFFG